ncbi:unnamed protein product [Urochloa humidicola]
MRQSRGRRTSRLSGAAARASPPSSDAAPPWPPPATLHLQPPFPVAPADAPKPWPLAPPRRRMRLHRHRPPRISGRPPLERRWSARPRHGEVPRRAVLLCSCPPRARRSRDSRRAVAPLSARRHPSLLLQPLLEGQMAWAVDVDAGARGAR